MLKYSKVIRGGLMTVALSSLAVTLFAQPKDNAPYSRIGLGEPVNHTLSSAAFGGLSAAYADPLHINLLNPASYGWLGATTFEMGMFTERSNLKFDGQEAGVWTGNLSHLALAFPMRNPLNDVTENIKRDFFWSMNIALLPNTMIGYDILTEEVHPDADTTTNIFQGSGGTNKLVWGNGFRYKNLSFGLNISYLFGQLERSREVRFQNIGPSFYDNYIDNISIRGLQWNVGVQYKLDLDKDVTEEDAVARKSLIFGLFGNPSSGFSTSSTVMRMGVNEFLSPIEYDTLFFETDVEGDGKLPAEWTLGVTYQHLNKLRLGAEYSFANWSSYENDAKPDVLYDSHRIAAGAEYSPDATSYNNYLKRIRYRAGFYYRTDPRLEDLNQFALTFGLGLPVILPRGQTSFVNLAFEFGRYDTSDAIQENFMKMSLGFTLNDGSWFYKRKFR